MSASNFLGKHLITCEEWTNQQIELIIEVAKELKRKFAIGESHKLLSDKMVFLMLFDQLSQIHNSLEAGITQLGGHAHHILHDRVQISHGASAKDTAIVLSRMGHAIAYKNSTWGEGNKYLNELVKWTSVPIISLQDEIYNPLQALADLMTLKEYFGNTLKGLKISIVWAYATSHRNALSIPHSQLLLFSRFGMDVTVGMPKEFPLNERVVHRARNHAQYYDCSLKLTNDVEEAYDDADIIIPQNWGGFGYFDNFIDDKKHEKELKVNMERNQSWICNKQKFDLSSPDVKLMHPLPADRGIEVTDEILDSPDSLIYDEAENRLHTVKAIMALTMGGRV